MIRRLKADVLSQLPPKIRQRIPFDLPKEAAKVDVGDIICICVVSVAYLDYR